MSDPRVLLQAFAGVSGDGPRAEWLGRYLNASGFRVCQDELGNLWAGQGSLLLVAHLDTVLTPSEPLAQDGRWWAPAIGDNSSGVAVLLSLAEQLIPQGVTLAFSVGEEGLGNLRGARALVAKLRPQAMVAVDGYLPSVVAQAVGSTRLRAVFTGPGGHAWGDRGQKSPVPALGQALAALYKLAKPENASLNVGRVFGGEAINAIPREVGLELDLRATDPLVLETLENQSRQILMEAAGPFGVGLELEVLGRRPAGHSATPKMIQAAKEALKRVGLEAQITPGSTDASAGVEQGIPALAFGVYRGGGAHTPQEWVEPDSLLLGQQALAELVRRLLGEL